jgi:ketosteroid isomerase-like protein
VSSDNKTVMEAYFAAWKARDFEALRRLLNENITFSSALGQVSNADDLIKGMQANLDVIHDVVVRNIFVDGSDVVTWFEIHTDAPRPIPAANFSHIENGKIIRAEAAFDTSTMRRVRTTTRH